MQVYHPADHSYGRNDILSAYVLVAPIIPVLWAAHAIFG